MPSGQLRDELKEEGMGSGADTPKKELNSVAMATDSPLDIQVGGEHYKGFKIQPVEYYMANGLSGLQSAIVKRISRYNQPTGKGLQDLRKIQHEIDLIIELEGWGI